MSVKIWFAAYLYRGHPEKRIKQQTKLGLEAKKYMDAGQLVPDEVVIGIVASRLTQPDCKNGFYLMDFRARCPKREALAEKVDIEIAINIDVPDENIIAFERPACARHAVQLIMWTTTKKLPAIPAAES